MTSHWKRVPSRRVLAANLERETEARLKAEATVESQAKYIEGLPYPSDVWSAEADARAFKDALDAVDSKIREVYDIETHGLTVHPAEVKGALRDALMAIGYTLEART